MAKKKAARSVKPSVISYSLDAIQGVVHRAGVFECPHCNHEPKDQDTWVKQAQRLCLAVVQGKHAAAAYVSSCPKCFQLSWVHHDLTSFATYHGFPEAWSVAADAERARRCVAALRSWAAGLCARCQHLEDGEVNTAARRTCHIGFGGPVTECNSFEEVSE